MGSFTITTLAGTVLAELPLDGAALDMVVGDLLERLPPPDGAVVPRLLFGARQLGWSERLADLGLTPGAVVTLVLATDPDPEKAGELLMGTVATPFRLQAARTLRAMGAAAAGQAEKLAHAVLSDPEAEVVREALQALRDVRAAAPGSEAVRLSKIAHLAHDLEDPREICVLEFTPYKLVVLIRELEALLARCDASPGQAALRRQTALRRLTPLDPEAARRHEPQRAAGPLEDPRPEVRLAAVAVLGSTVPGRWQEREDACRTLCGLLQGDACPGVRIRAAAAVVRACRHLAGQHLPVPQTLEASLELARATLAAEVEALRRSDLMADRMRMERVHLVLG